MINETEAWRRRLKLPVIRFSAPLPQTLASYDRMGEEDELAVMGNQEHGNIWVQVPWETSNES